MRLAEGHVAVSNSEGVPERGITRHRTPTPRLSHITWRTRSWISRQRSTAARACDPPMDPRHMSDN